MTPFKKFTVVWACLSLSAQGVGLWHLTHLTPPETPARSAARLTTQLVTLAQVRKIRGPVEIPSSAETSEQSRGFQADILSALSNQMELTLSPADRKPLQQRLTQWLARREWLTESPSLKERPPQSLLEWEEVWWKKPDWVQITLRLIRLDPSGEFVQASSLLATPTLLERWEKWRLGLQYGLWVNGAGLVSLAILAWRSKS